MTESLPSRSTLEVLLATTSYPLDSADWKARFIYDLAASIDRTGEVHVQLWGPPGHLPGDVSSANSRGDTAWLHQLAGDGGIAHLLRTRPVTGLIQARGILSRLREACARNRVDLYHVNWLQLALGLPDDGRPLYVGVLGSDFGLLRLPGMARLLHRKFGARPTVLAPNAGWMQPRLTELFGDVAAIRPNPFGVAPAWFDVQRQVGEPKEWLVVSRVTRKKLGDLLRWGKGLFGRQRRLRLLGPMQEDVALPAWIAYGGPTNPDSLQQQWFPGAAGLLTLSRHDEGRPQVMIEAMAAGLPVIASRIPAHADLIHHGETGWLVDSRDELAEALNQAEADGAADLVGNQARDWVRDEIGTWDDCATRCLTAYRDLLTRNPGNER